jgi:hypothetical protein
MMRVTVGACSFVQICSSVPEILDIAFAGAVPDVNSEPGNYAKSRGAALLMH